MSDRNANPAGFRVYVGRAPMRDAFVIDAYSGGGMTGYPMRHHLATGGELVSHDVGEGDTIETPTLTIPGLVPGGFLVALYDGLTEFVRDKMPDPGTEARVLREWLAVEQRRVDDVLASPRRLL